MTPSRRGLHATLATLGTVATAAGLSGVLRGASEVTGAGPVSAPVDSEYRFYAAWYPVFGILLLRAARAPEDEARIVHAAAAGLITAAGGRLLSWRTLGQPNRLQQVLLGLEILIPAVIVPWQHRVARARTTGLTA